ncbi:MAG: AI-2E family transporter [Thermoleophilia bacterium]
MGGIWSDYTRRVIGLLVLAAVLFVVWAARGVLTPLVIALVLAFLIEPLVDGLNRRLKVPRFLAAVVVLLVLLALFLLAIAVLGPVLVDQFSQVGFNLEDAVNGFLKWLRSTSDSFRDFSLFGYRMDLNTYVDSFQARLDPEGLVGFLPSGQQLFGSLDNILSTTAGTLAGFASTLGHLLLTLFLTLIYSLYLVNDGPRLANAVRGLIPQGHESELDELRSSIGRVWRAYFRGQLLMVTIFGALVGVSLWALGLPSALIVGIMAGVMDLVPTLGALVAGGLAVLMALVQGSEHLALGNGLFALVVLGVYLGLQQVEASVLQPRIMGRSVELPGIVIIVGIMAGASVAGILGAYLAVPIMATARLVFLYVHTKLTEVPSESDEVAGEPPCAQVSGDGVPERSPTGADGTGEPAPSDPPGAGPGSFPIQS